MAIKRKPQALESFINGENKDKKEKKVSNNVIKPIVLRLPMELLEEMNLAVEKRRPSPSRHQWILEAIYEKLENQK